MTRVGRSLLLTAALAAGCASDGDEPQLTATPPPLPASTTTAVISPTEHDSSATIVIADEEWSFEATCAQPAEGDVLVWGSGTTPERGRPAELLLEASLDSPYVGITGDGRLIEAAVDSPLLLTIDAGVISGTGITWVADADIDTGVGDDLGTGTVRVECRSYAAVTPPE